MLGWCLSLILKLVGERTAADQKVQSALKTALGAARRLGTRPGFPAGFGVLGPRAIDDENLADVLHRGGGERFADFLQQRFTRCALIKKNADFDQFMTAEAPFDFVEHRRPKPGVAKHYDRTQCVGTRA